MVQPIQYGIQAPSAFESLVSGLKLGTSLQEMQAQRALREQQALQIQQNIEQKRQQQEALKAIRSARPEDLTQEFVNRYTGLISAEQQKLMQEQFNTYDTQRQSALAGQYGQMAQLAFSNVDEAQVNGFFDQLIGAQDSESAKKALEAERKAFLSAPNKDFYGKQKLIMLRALGGKGKEVADQVNSLNMAKTESLSSDKLRKREAEADQAVAQAKTAQATAKTADEKAAADLKLANANAARAQVQADYEERQQKADLDKKAQELGLTAAQKNKVFAETSKLSSETKKIALELAALEASGGVDPSKKFDQEEKLRKEFTARTKVFNELDSTFSNLKASEQAGTGPGDIALITGFMKMLDPGSVVRETEFATARDTAGLFTRLENSLQRLQNGEFLKPPQRQEYINLAKQYYDAAKQKANIEKQSIAKVVTNYKLNPDNVFGVEAAPVAPGAAGAGQRNITQSFSQRPQSAPTPAQTPTPAAGGAQRNVKVDY
jgi:hypothetical protein